MCLAKPMMGSRHESLHSAHQDKCTNAKALSAVAFSREGDPQFRYFEDAIILGIYGDVSADYEQARRLSRWIAYTIFNDNIVNLELSFPDVSRCEITAPRASKTCNGHRHRLDLRSRCYICSRAREPGNPGRPLFYICVSGSGDGRPLAGVVTAFAGGLIAAYFWIPPTYLI